MLNFATLKLLTTGLECVFCQYVNIIDSFRYYEMLH